MFMEKMEKIRCYEDTEKLWKENGRLKKAIEASVAGTRFYAEGETPNLPAPRYDTTDVSVQNRRTFDTAMAYHRKYPSARIAAHNFASARDDDGDILPYSMAQEGALCRISTLLPVLARDGKWQRRYASQWELENLFFTDDCLYTPGILIVKTDEDRPTRLPATEWTEVDVLTCAAPIIDFRLFKSLSEEDIFAIHKQRGRHILSIAAANAADILILGACGCGPFHNPPEIVAEAYHDLLQDFRGQFREVVFAIYYAPWGPEIYDAFMKVFDGR